ncbi:serine/threonine dehydratase [Rhodococcus sp. G-MC3]|uniref:serine/threonine dehydratase n=1 Tax=Rhodococcus sp. G-MC3 TaxID=3046209 RepID=UPI0024B9995F|nr:serine/threonine dehydratase [Rhodococcus sp. G-MC3]MDJ0395968.1 serine/threonine dehydratase [Rhodococcus sp. G-MC3]
MDNALTYRDVLNARARISGMVRPVAMIRGDGVSFAAEFMQHTGTFKARGAANFVAYHRESNTMPDAGVVIASGGNAGLACAWAAAAHDVPATVFVPATVPVFKKARLEALGADVRAVGSEYAEALDASVAFASESGALSSHAYDHPLIAAGAGTLALEIVEAGAVDTVVVSVGGGGLFAGIATVAAHHGIRVVAVEPAHCRAFAAGLEAGTPVNVTVASIAADSLGARRVTALALEAAAAADTVSVLVDDDAIIEARKHLWDSRRLVVEHAASTALAALRTGAYRPGPGERVAVVLCGANSDPSDVV